MKVLFINTYDNAGGAAMIRLRLDNVLRRNFNCETRTLVAYKNANDSNTYPLRNKFEEITEKIVDRVSGKLGAQYLFFPFTKTSILRKAREFTPDVINIHNTHGGYFQTDLLKPLSKVAPIVWTLHDMWSFTGNAAHTFGDEGWKTMQNPSKLKSVPPEIGINTGRYLLRHKKSVYAQSDLTLVTPSKWLFNLAKVSPVFEGKRIVHINNGLDLNLFKPGDGSAIRTRLGIPRDARVLMFSAEKLHGNPWKGGRDLIDILTELAAMNNDMPIHLLAVGVGGVEDNALDSSFSIHNVGFVKSQDEMREYYRAADLFVYPTKADNLPNVLVEAIACGLPCATFDVGGCKEIIRDGYNGIIADVNTAPVKIHDFLQTPEKILEMKNNARKHAETFFSDNDMGVAYMNLFNSLQWEGAHR